MTNNHVWHLVARKLAGEATLDELRELEQVLRDDPELAYQVDLYTGYYEAVKPSERSGEQETASWASTRSRLSTEFPDAFQEMPETHMRSFQPKKLLIAASVLITFTLGLYIYFSSGVGKPHTPLTASLNEMKTMPGTRTKIVLPDGTQVWLNSDSYITYNKDFGQTKREITLKGEAFFDVFHNPDVPMVVHARSVNILVKGTAFNVRNYPESSAIETALIRGSVELTTNGDPSRKILLKPNEKITIDAKPAATTKEAGRAPVIKPSYYHIDALKESTISNTIPEIAWVQNKLVFDNEAFSEVMLKMEKWYNTKFVLKNEELAAKKFSGAFEKESVYEALSALQMINHFDFTINGNEIIIK